MAGDASLKEKLHNFLTLPRRQFRWSPNTRGFSGKAAAICWREFHILREPRAEIAVVFDKEAQMSPHRRGSRIRIFIEQGAENLALLFEKIGNMIFLALGQAIQGSGKLCDHKSMVCMPHIGLAMGDR